jgi:hypothetical protein
MAHKIRVIVPAGIVSAVMFFSLLFNSCVDNKYDLKNLSSEMSIGGDSLIMPVGSTDTIKISDFLDEKDVEMLKIMENGGYGLSMEDSIDVAIPKIDQTKLKIDDQIFVESQSLSFGYKSLENFKIPGNSSSADIERFDTKKRIVKASTLDMTILSTTFQLNTLTADVKDSTIIDINLSDIPKEIVSLDSIILSDNATLQLSVDITNLPALSNPFMANMKIKFPELFQFDQGAVDSENCLNINQSFIDGKMNKILGIRSLHLDGKATNGKLSINEKVKFDGIVYIEDPSVNIEELNSGQITVNMQVKLTGIRFESIYGKVNPGIDPIETEISLSNIPEFMKGDDIVLDVKKSIIALETESNIEIPVDIGMDLKPIKNGSVISDNQQSVTLHIPKSNSISKPTKTYFWIAPDSVGKPQNYGFIKADIQKLFRTIPDKIEFDVDAQANTTEQHFIDLNADYKMKVNYKVSIPLAFGKDLMIIMKDTISDIDESIGEMAFSGHKLELLGSIYNSIPLEIELELKPLDENNQVINVESARQIISAGAFDGSAVRSDIGLEFNDPNRLLKNLRGFELVFRASSNETVAGAPIKPENYIKADLKVRINGGINISE